MINCGVIQWSEEEPHKLYVGSSNLSIRNQVLGCQQPLNFLETKTKWHPVNYLSSVGYSIGATNANWVVRLHHEGLVFYNCSLAQLVERHLDKV